MNEPSESDQLLGVDINSVGPTSLPWLAVAGVAVLFMIQAVRSSSLVVELAKRMME